MLAINFVICREHYPRFCRQPKARSSAFSAATMRRRRLCRPTPCAQPKAPSLATAAEGPQLRLALAMQDAQNVSIAGEVGARGRADSPTKAGGNCENLQGFAGSE